VSAAAHALEWQAAAAALIRAMPRHRMVGNGMQATDADELHAGVSAGAAWSEVAARLARRQTRLAVEAMAVGDPVTAREKFLRAAA